MTLKVLKDSRGFGRALPNKRSGWQEEGRGRRTISLNEGEKTPSPSSCVIDPDLSAMQVSFRRKYSEYGDVKPLYQDAEREHIQGRVKGVGTF